MSEKRTQKRSRVSERPTRGRADLAYLRKMSEGEVERFARDDLGELPDDFWDHANLVIPPTKRGIYLRVDEDVIDWFRSQGPRYQTRMNAVLRSFMERTQTPGRSSTRAKTRKTRK